MGVTRPISSSSNRIEAFAAPADHRLAEAEEFFLGLPSSRVARIALRNPSACAGSRGFLYFRTG